MRIVESKAPVEAIDVAPGNKKDVRVPVTGVAFRYIVTELSWLSLLVYMTVRRFWIRFKYIQNASN